MPVLTIEIHWRVRPDKAQDGRVTKSKPYLAVSVAVADRAGRQQPAACRPAGLRQRS
jgi:hypothetical protein